MAFMYTFLLPKEMVSKHPLIQASNERKKDLKMMVRVLVKNISGLNGGKLKQSGKTAEETQVL